MLGTVTAATELTIQWNGIDDVSDVSSAGQTIPLLIGVGLVGRVLYIALFGDLDEEDRVVRTNSPNPVDIIPGLDGIAAPVDAIPPMARPPIAINEFPVHGVGIGMANLDN